MPPLTREKISLYSKSQNLQDITKLKCWGREINDISVLKEEVLPNLEILNLSVNKIKNIESIKSCLKLKELYLRCNQLDDSDQIIGVCKGLKDLSSLWVDKNPFLYEDLQASQPQDAEISVKQDQLSNSQLTELVKILKNLPHLKRLNGKSKDFYLNSYQSTQAVLNQKQATPTLLHHPDLKKLPSPASTKSTGTADSKSSRSFDNIQIPTSVSENTSPAKSNVSNTYSTVLNGSSTMGQTSNILRASLALLPSLSKDELLTLQKAIEEQVCNIEVGRVRDMV